MLKTIKVLTGEIKEMLSAYKVPYKMVNIGSNLPEVFLIDTFGIIVIGLDRKDYSFIYNKIIELYPGYRMVYISTTSDILKKKDDLLWNLMRSGYMRYIRTNFPNQFKTLIINYGLGRKIINKRLEIWDDAPMYKFLIEENKSILNQAESYVLSIDPSFYDYMPEE